MERLYHKIFTLLITLGLAVGLIKTAEAAPSGYEWWLDSDRSTVQTGSMTSSDLTLPVDLSGLPLGVHYFNFRMNSEDGDWGSVYRKMFYTVDNATGAVAYEYWLDNDFEGKTEGNITGSQLSFPIDLANTKAGIHYFNCRLFTNYGGWGATYRKMILTTPMKIDVSGFEYWLDDNYSAKVEGDVTTDSVSYDVNLAGLKKGLHRVNYRMRNGFGEWGAPYSRYFFYTSSESPFTTYEYWLDNDYEHKVQKRTNSNPVMFDVDLTGYDKSGEAHYFNLRVRDDDGEWSSFYRKLIVFYKDHTKAPIIGYRHSINGNDLGYVTLEKGVTGSHTFMVDLPDDLGFSLRDKTLNFHGDEVSVEGKDSVHYMMQMQTEIGWSSPTLWDMELNHDFATTAVEMKLNSSHTFDKPKSGQFAALKFNTNGEELYFRVNESAVLDLYKESALVHRIESNDLTAMTSLPLESGEYFGILHESPVNDANQSEELTLHLMTTPNMVPNPGIAFINGKVSMICEREDARIYYTLDGSAPNESSVLYTEPFTLDRNAVVKAIAYCNDPEIAPSNITELVIDTFIVIDPKITFSNLMFTITQDERTGVVTYYTLDGKEPTQESTAYSGPFSMSGNGKVRARSFKDGYNPSGIVEYNYVHSVYVTKAPLISEEAGVVTLTSQTEGSTLYYAIGDADPEKMQPYESPITMTATGTIYAQARKSGMYDSEVVSYECIIPVIVPAPEIKFNNGRVTITCSLENVSIYYTLDDSAPNKASAHYTEPFALDRNAVIKAVAYADDVEAEPSDIAELLIDTFTVIDPKITFSNLMFTIMQDDRTGVVTYYTLDGKEPTQESTAYSGPFSMSGNGKVRARSFKDGYNPSGIVEYNYVHSEYVALPPVISYSDDHITLTAQTEGSTLYYAIDNDNPDAMTEYQSPVAIGGNCIIYARATKQGMYDSAVVSFEISDLKCTDVRISYNGRYVTLYSDEDDVDVCYTLDGSDPTGGDIYGGEFDSEGLKTVKAVAMKRGYMNSDVTEYEIRGYADEEHAETSVAGILESCFAWTGYNSENSGNLIDGVESYRFVGTLNEADHSLITSMKSLRHLYLEDAVYEGMPERAFADMKLITVSLPRQIAFDGEQMFGENPELCVIRWNEQDVALNNLWKDVTNPNLLLFMEAGCTVANEDVGASHNYIRDGKSDKIELLHGYPYYSPYDYEAKEISYIREFNKQTEVGGCSGWETLAVPFDVETVYSAAGEITPFAAAENPERPFWLYKPVATGWERTATIEANLPYLLAMPNNPWYDAEYNISGTVTFKAENAFVRATPELECASYRNGSKMWPNFSHIPADDEVWTINDDWFDGKAPGSVFVAGERDVKPFECYVTSSSSARYMPIFDASDVQGVMSQLGTEIWVENHDLCILSGISRKVRVFDTVGQLVRIADVVAGEVCRVHDLAPGIYIVGELKIMVK